MRPSTELLAGAQQRANLHLVRVIFPVRTGLLDFALSHGKTYALAQVDIRITW